MIIDILQTGIWEVCIDNNQTHAEDIAVQVESRPRRVRTSTRPDQQSQYPITLRTKIVNSEPDFNNSKWSEICECNL